MILEQYKGVHCVDLGESFQTRIYLENLASIQPRTSPVKCARPCGEERVGLKQRAVIGGGAGPFRGVPRAARSTQPRGGEGQIANQNYLPFSYKFLHCLKFVSQFSHTKKNKFIQMIKTSSKNLKYHQNIVKFQNDGFESFDRTIAAKTAN